MLLACSVIAGAQPADDPVAGLGTCFDRQAAGEPFSGVVLAGHGSSIFERALGTSDAAGKAAFDRNTSVRLASVQKVLTRVAIGRLVEAGKVDLDAPAGRYVSGLPEAIAAVTVDQLLQHRSGVAPLTRIGPREGQVFSAAKSARDFLPLITSEPLGFPPGSKEEYSNGGYLLLGAIIEAASGISYAAYLGEAVLKPLGMSATALDTNQGTAVRMTRLPPMPGQPMFPTPQPMRGGPDFRGSPAGDGVSSAADLLTLGQALLGDKLLSPAVKARIFPRRGERWRIGQSGGSIGVNTDLTVYPDDGWVLVTLSNYDPPAGELMAEVLRNAALGKGCNPLTSKDRPSPFKLMGQPARKT